MKRTGFWITILLAWMCVATAQAQIERPKLVVGIVVDQMRWDYLYTYYNNWGQGGFRRLIDQGFSLDNTLIDYVPTVTAAGHASIYTGTTPAIHGIAGNDYMLHGSPTSSVRDTTVAGVGTNTSTGKRSPRNLLATTIGDQMKLATDFQARVVGVAIKDRAAVLPAGHAADGAYWFDGKVKRFVTSTYYCKELPQWVSRFNNEHQELLAGDLWNSWRGAAATMQLACAAIEGEQLGTDDVPDLLAISISSTDAAAHNYGLHVPRVDSIYYELDRQMARFFDLLDRKVGKGQYLVFLSADHGGTYTEPFMTGHRMVTGCWNPSQAFKDTNAALEAKFGVPRLLKSEMEFSFYLDNDLIAARGLDRDAVADEAVRLLSAPDEVQWVVDFAHLDRYVLPADLRERLVKGYKQDRSGELFIIPTVGVYARYRPDAGANHGTWSQSDSHIPFVMMGWGVPHGATSRQVAMTDIAPTVCALLHIQAPNGCIGRPVTEITDQSIKR
ncbi:MAG: alkaline phosphatase family protein [Muribaculaceae bacterium]|nr:alkaline phosphatase family protein [Muribaculaceae bacterium]